MPSGWPHCRCCGSLSGWSRRSFAYDASSIVRRDHPGVAVLKWLPWAAGTVVLLILLDRLLLRLEAKGRIFYRRTRGVRGGAMYHAQELDSIFNPGMQHVQEAHVRQEQKEDESGDPPIPDCEANT